MFDETTLNGNMTTADPWVSCIATVKVIVIKTQVQVFIKIINQSNMPMPQQKFLKYQELVLCN